MNGISPPKADFQIFRIRFFVFLSLETEKVNGALDDYRAM